MTSPSASPGWYSEQHILFVWAQTLRRSAAFFCVVSEDVCNPELKVLSASDLFPASPTLVSVCRAALVVTHRESPTPYTITCLAPLFEPAPGRLTLSLCTGVDFSGLRSGTKQCDVSDIATAALQIQQWNRQKPRDRALRNHAIFVSYQYRVGHWCLLLVLLGLDVSLADGATTVRSMELHLFDPLSPCNELPQQGRKRLQVELARYLTVPEGVVATSERLPLELGGGEVVYAKQQADKPSCGVITAANGASLLCDSLHALWQRCPAGASDLRAKHSKLAADGNHSCFDADLKRAVTVMESPPSGMDYVQSRSFLSAVTSLCRTDAAQKAAWDRAFSLLAANVSDDANQVGRASVKSLLLENRSHFERLHSGMTLFSLLLCSPPETDTTSWRSSATAILEHAAEEYFAIQDSSPQPPAASDAMYQKTALTPAGLSGFLYQARVMALYAWDAVERKIPFELRAEDPSFGKVDDLILFEEDRIIVMQVKHASGKDKVYSLKHLSEKENKKKAAIVLYFDTWAMLEDKRRTRHSLLKSRRRIDYKFVTNHSLDSTLHGLYSQRQQRFSDSFLDGTELTEEQRETRCDLVNSILQQSSYLRQIQKRGLNLLDSFQIDLTAKMHRATEFVKMVLAPWFVSEFRASEKPQLAEVTFRLRPQAKSLSQKSFEPPDDFEDPEQWNQDFLRIAFYALFQREWQQIGATQWHADVSSPSQLQREFLGYCAPGDNDCCAVLWQRLRVETKSKLLRDDGAALYLVKTGLGANAMDMEDVKVDVVSPSARWVVPPRFMHWLPLICDQNALSVPMGEQVPPGLAPLAIICDALRNALAIRLREKFLAHPSLRVDPFDGKGLPPRLRAFFQEFSFQYSYSDDSTVSADLQRRMRCTLRSVDPTYQLEFFWHILDDLRQIATNGITSDSVQELIANTQQQVKQSHLTGYTEKWVRFLRQEFSALAPSAAEHGLWPLLDIFFKAAPPRLLTLRCPESEMLCVSVAIADFTERKYNADSGTWALLEAHMCREDDVKLLLGQESLTHFMVVNAASLFLLNSAGELEPSIGTQLLAGAAAKRKHVLLLLGEEEDRLRAVNLFAGGLANLPTVPSDVVRLRLSPDQLHTELLRAGDAQLRVGAHSILLSSVAYRPHCGLFSELRNPVNLALALRHAQDVSHPNKAARTDIFVPLKVQVMEPCLSWPELALVQNLILLVSDPEAAAAGRAKCESLPDVDWLQIDKVVHAVEKRGGKRLWLPWHVFEACLLDECADRRNLIKENKQCFATCSEYESDAVCHWLQHEYPAVLGIRKSDDDESPWKLTESASFECVRTLPPRRYHLERILVSPSQHAELLVRHEHPRRLVLVAFYGAGKTRFFKRLQEQHAESTLTAESFSWTVFIPLSTLSSAQNSMPLAEMLAQYLPPMSQLESTVFRRDCELFGALLLLDGWDEMTPRQRTDCGEILRRLFEYPYLLVSSRPSDESRIPLAPNQHLRLKPFDEANILNYINEYFAFSHFESASDSQFCRESAQTLIQLWQRSGALDLLGKPLLCRLTCAIVSERMRLSLVPTEVQPSLATLFDEFITVSLRKYHRDRAYLEDSRFSKPRIWQWSRRETELMRVTAFSRLFQTKSAVESSPMEFALPYDEADLDIAALGLMRPDGQLNGRDYQFDHQTIAEYFAALHLLTLLARAGTETPKEWVDFFCSRFYQQRFTVVWTFLAGLACNRAAEERVSHSVTLGNTAGPCEQAIATLLRILAQMVHESPDIVGEAAAAAFSGFADALDLAIVRASLERVPLSSPGTLLDLVTEWRLLAPISLEKGISDNEVVDKSNLPHLIDADDEDIVQSASYGGYLTRATLESSVNRKLEVGGQEFNKLIEKVCAAIALAAASTAVNLDTGELFLLAMSVNDDSVPPERLSSVVRLLKSCYLADPEPLNTTTYQEAYISLMALVDAARVPFSELVPDLTRNFNQKYAVHDLIRRLKQVDLLTTDHVQLVFGSCNRFNRNGFWNFNVGLPLILLMKEDVCETMMSFVLHNLMQGGISSGGYSDFEVGLAGTVLIRLSRVAFSESRHIVPMLNVALSLSVKPAPLLQARFNDLAEFRENMLSSYERTCLLGSIIELFDKATATRAALTVENFHRAQACLHMLFDAAITHGLPVMLRDGHVHFGAEEPTVQLCASGAADALPAQVAWQQLLIRFYFHLDAQKLSAAKCSGNSRKRSPAYDLDKFSNTLMNLHSFAAQHPDATKVAPVFAMGALSLPWDPKLARLISPVDAAAWHDYLWPHLLRVGADIEIIASQLTAISTPPACEPPVELVSTFVAAWTERLGAHEERFPVQWLVSALLELARLQPALDGVLEQIDQRVFGGPRSYTWLFLERYRPKQAVRLETWSEASSALERWKWPCEQAEAAVCKMLDSCLPDDYQVEEVRPWGPCIWDETQAERQDAFVLLRLYLHGDPL
ncbi:Nucleotide-binding oligomerization domain-containing protein 2 [Geranomyces variabilis]|nr:Nucleotide-binding oligomerization domain-containing protein 2 [Geranomyces variabilis]